MTKDRAGQGPLTVSVVIPARDEESYIANCIDAIGAQDLPLGEIEVVVVDGASRDETVARAEQALRRFDFGRAAVVENELGTTPSNLNRGLAQVGAPILCRVDARSLVPVDYLRRCRDLLWDRPDVSVAGGSQMARPRTAAARDRGIARALNNRWAMGMSKYRRGGVSGVSDTVYLGVFRTDDLREVGGWNESLSTNQDFDLNRRMARRGLVWFLESLEVGYVPRASHADLYRQYVRFGSAKVHYWRSSGDRPRPRQVAALAVAPTALLAALIWLRLPASKKVASVLGVVVAGVTVEELGAQGGRAGMAERSWSLAAVGCVWGGWSIGAWRGLVRDSQQTASGA